MFSTIIQVNDSNSRHLLIMTQTLSVITTYSKIQTGLSLTSMWLPVWQFVVLENACIVTPTGSMLFKCEHVEERNVYFLHIRRECRLIL